MRFNVTLRDIAIYDLEGIEAENEKEAIDIAWEKLLSMTETEKSEVFSDSDGESEVEECQS